MLTVDRHPTRAARPGDEALIYTRAVQVRPRDGAGEPVVGPIDVLAVDRDPSGARPAPGKTLIGV
jgi:hypothetical protein